MEELAIGEVARRTGLRPTTLRYYERLGLVPAPARRNGRRRYAPSVLPLLEVLRSARQAGFTLAEIGCERWAALGRAKLAELDGVIRRARRMKRVVERGLACGCVRIEDCALPGTRGPARAQPAAPAAALPGAFEAG